MRWHKVARLVVAGIGIACAWVVYQALRPMPASTDTTATTPPMLDATVTSTSSKGKIIDVDSLTGRVLYELNYLESRSLSDGRSIFSDVDLMFDRNGVPYTIEALEAEVEGQMDSAGRPSKVVFRGSVHMKGADGFCVEAEHATYLGDEQRITFPGEVAFTRDRLSGQGIGADLYMDRSVFWMYNESELTVSPDAGGVPVVARATRIGLADADHYMRLEEGAQLTRQDQELSSGVMVVHFQEATQELRRIELDDQAVVRRTGGRPGPDMRADRIDLDFTPVTTQLSHARLERNSALTLREDSGTTGVSGTDIEMFVGTDGQTLTRLQATGPVNVSLPLDGTTPARTIQAASLLAQGAEPKGLDRATFGGGVTYCEASTPCTGPSAPARGRAAGAPRMATATSLELGLGGTLHQVDVATFRQNVSVSDEAITATAEEGRYNAKAGTLQLKVSDSARLASHVVTERMVVRAKEIDLDLNGEGIDARGSVKSELIPETPSGAQTTDATGLFEPGKTIVGNADALKYSKATGVAAYTGSVTLFQSGGAGREGTFIQANAIQLDEQKKDMSAKGRVISTLFVDGTPEAEEAQQGPSKTKLTSDQMEYKEGTRSAVYSGNAKMESGSAQGLTADQITLELFRDRRALQRLVATAAPKGEVRATMLDGRQASGQRLTYESSTEEYRVTGEPAQFVSRSATKGPDICDIAAGSVLTFLRTAKFANVQTQGGAVGRANEAKCAEVIK